MLDFPSTHLNRDAIAQVLADLWPSDSPRSFLEIASGSGQHSHHFAKLFPNWSFQPSDLEPEHVQSIQAYREALSFPNVAPPILLDASASQWTVPRDYDVLMVINMIHISPWASTVGLFREGSQKLKEAGEIYLYGAYQREGTHTSPSNEAFDRSLRSRNPQWGVRHLEQVQALAAEHGMSCREVIQMPANNLSVVFQKS